MKSKKPLSKGLSFELGQRFLQVGVLVRKRPVFDLGGNQRTSLAFRIDFADIPRSPDRRASIDASRIRLFNLHQRNPGADNSKLRVTRKQNSQARNGAQNDFGC